jgi:hypothetical protein
VSAARQYRARDAFRDRGFLIDTLLAPLLFVAVNAAFGLVPAAASAVALALIVLSWRAFRRERATNAVLGLLGVIIATSIALATGSAAGYFWPRALLNAGWALAFLGSVVIGRPAIAFFAHSLYRLPWTWLSDARVRPAFAEVTLAWAVFFAVKAAVFLLLIVAGKAGVLAVVTFVLGWPAFIFLLWAGYRYVGWRLQRLGAPDPWKSEDAAVAA